MWSVEAEGRSAWFVGSLRQWSDKGSKEAHGIVVYINSINPTNGASTIYLL